MSRSYKRITEFDAEQIRMERENGSSISELAQRYRRCNSVISRICTGDLAPNAGGPLAPRVRHRINEEQAAEILQTLSVHKHYIGRPIGTEKLAPRYGVTRATIDRFRKKALKWIDNFWSKIDRSGSPEACWPWKGAHFKRKGSPGRFVVVTYHKRPGDSTGRPRTQAFRAHRLAVELSTGRVRGRLVHRGPMTCEGCCNPLHWEERAKHGSEQV